MICIFYGLVSSILIFPNIIITSEKYEVYFDIFHSECQKIDILITSKVGNDSIESKIQLKINYLLKKSVKILLIKNK